MGHVFVSHSSKDRAQVERLAALLDTQYTPYFLDYDPQVGIPAGRRWEDDGAAHARQLLDAQKLASAAETRSAGGCWQTLLSSKHELAIVDGALDAAAARSAVPHCTLRHDHDVRHAIFSPDESHLATVSDGDHVRVWNLAQGVEVSRLTLPVPNVADAAFSHDGRIIATAGWDGQVRLWWWRVAELVSEARGRVTRELSADERQRHMPGQADARAPARPA